MECSRHSRTQRRRTFRACKQTIFFGVEAAPSQSTPRELRYRRRASKSLDREAASASLKKTRRRSSTAHKPKSTCDSSTMSACSPDTEFDDADWVPAIKVDNSIITVSAVWEGSRHGRTRRRRSFRARKQTEFLGVEPVTSQITPRELRCRARESKFLAREAVSACLKITRRRSSAVHTSTAGISTISTCSSGTPSARSSDTPSARSSGILSACSSGIPSACSSGTPSACSSGILSPSACSSGILSPSACSSGILSPSACSSGILSPSACSSGTDLDDAGCASDIHLHSISLITESDIDISIAAPVPVECCVAEDKGVKPQAVRSVDVSQEFAEILALSDQINALTLECTDSSTAATPDEKAAPNSPGSSGAVVPGNPGRDAPLQVVMPLTPAFLLDVWGNPPKLYPICRNVEGKKCRQITSYSETLREPAYLIQFHGTDQERYFVMHQKAFQAFPGHIQIFLHKNKIRFRNPLYNVHFRPDFNPYDPNKFKENPPRNSS